MTKIESFYNFFIHKFTLFRRWKKESELSTREKVAMISSLVFCEIVPVILIPLNFLRVETTEVLVITLMYSVGYFLNLLFTIMFRLYRPELRKFLRKFATTMYGEDQLAIPYIYEACIKAQRVTKIMTVLYLVAVNIPMIAIPYFWGVLPIPMFLPSWTTSGAGFWIAWIYQVIIFNFGIKTFYNIMFAYTLWFLIIGYAKFLADNLGELSSGRGWMDGRGDLIKCIRRYLRLIQ